MPQHSDFLERGGHKEAANHGARIKVVGVGGGGNNAINRMIDAGLGGVEFLSINTDLKPLQDLKAHTRLQIGARLTRGLGTGANSDVGRQAALEDTEKIIESLEGADMVFVTAGLGGGTGTGASPVVASLASQMGILTVAVVTRPFVFEGKRRMAQAERGVSALLDQSDTLIVIPNERLLVLAGEVGFFDSFKIADDVLRQAVQGIADVITVRGIINRDLADLRTTIAGMGYAVMGTAARSGPGRAAAAARGAITSPLIEVGAIDGARGILINITGSSSLRLSEVSEASTIIQNAAHEDANIIFGAVLDERLGDEVKVTVVATGFLENTRERTERRLEMLNRMERQTIYADASARNGSYCPIVPHPTSSPELVLGVAEPLNADASPNLEMVILPVTGESPSNEKNTEDAQSIVATPLEGQSPVEFSDPPELYFTNEWFDDLPAQFSASGTGATPAEIGSETLSETTPIQAEVARLRQTAIAAYAESSTIAEKEPIHTEVSSFAEVLASREKLHRITPPEDTTATTSTGLDHARQQDTLPEQNTQKSGPAFHVPRYAALPEQEEWSPGFDELDIPTFLRRSP